MRISDWSSDVCSSDLGRIDDRAALAPLGHQTGIGQLGKVEAHRGSGHVKRFGQGASGDTALARLHQQAERGEPMLMRQSGQERKSVVEGKSGSVRVDLGGSRIIKKKNKQQQKT